MSKKDRVCVDLTITRSDKGPSNLENSWPDFGPSSQVSDRQTGCGVSTPFLRWLGLDFGFVRTNTTPGEGTREDSVPFRPTWSGGRVGTHKVWDGCGRGTNYGG